MDRGSIIVAALTAAAVGLAVTGTLTQARTPLQTRVVESDVDLSGATHLVVRSTLSDVRIVFATGAPGAHVRLQLRGSPIDDDEQVRAERSGDTVNLVIGDYRGVTNGRIVAAYTGQVDAMAAVVTVRTPIDVSVRTGSGAVTVEHPPRAFDGATATGDVTVDDPHGNVRATTGSGDVELHVGPAFAGNAIFVGTSSGDVAVQVPSGFRAALRTHTDSGSVSDDAHVAGGTRPSMRVTTSSGNIHTVTAP